MTYCTCWPQGVLLCFCSASSSEINKLLLDQLKLNKNVIQTWLLWACVLFFFFLLLTVTNTTGHFNERYFILTIFTKFTQRLAPCHAHHLAKICAFCCCSTCYNTAPTKFQQSNTLRCRFCSFQAGYFDKILVDISSDQLGFWSDQSKDHSDAILQSV